MSKRKPLDKAQIRERRDRMLEAAAAADLSLTDGVREMRAIAGMTQEEFARHRGVSGRVIKAIELGQGNPTVATLNRIGEFFGLEVAFVPVRRTLSTAVQPQSNTVAAEIPATPRQNKRSYVKNAQMHAELQILIKGVAETIQEAVLAGLKIPQTHLASSEQLRGRLNKPDNPVDASMPEQPAAKKSTRSRKKKTSGSP